MIPKIPISLDIQMGKISVSWGEDLLTFNHREKNQEKKRTNCFETQAKCVYFPKVYNDFDKALSQVRQDLFSITLKSTR